MAQNIEHLLDCFQNLEIEDIEYLSKSKTRIDYLKGETIFKQGAFAPHVLFVNKGLVRVFLQTAKEKHINISIAEQGDFMAFSSLFNTNTYQYSAVAQVDSTICMIEKEALRNVIVKNPSFAMQVTSKNCNNESRFLEIISNVSYRQMRGKLASVLLYLAEFKYKGDNIFRFLTRQEIADFASITVESTVKFLKEFEKEGLILLNGKNISIKDSIELNVIKMIE